MYVLHSLLDYSRLIYSRFQKPRRQVQIFQYPPPQNQSSRQSVSDINFDPLTYWPYELPRIESTPLNPSIDGMASYSYLGTTFTEENISYDSPNWVNATPSVIRIVATLLLPPNANTSIGQIPGVLLMHGLYGKRQDMRDYGNEICNLNCIVLMPDHPGHGDSGGAVPTPENLYYQGAFNQTSHMYLTIVAAIQGVRLLQSLTAVNASDIAVSGASYGGLMSMFVGSIYSQYIKIVLPMIATGDIQDLSPESLFFQIMNISKSNIPQSYWNQQMHLVDPLYYLQNPDYPLISWFIGTTDDFFSPTCVNPTYAAVNRDSGKWIQIAPNWHHIASGNDGMLLYMIKYALLGGPAPPEFTNVSTTKNTDWTGDQLHITASIANTTDLSGVQIYFRYSLFTQAWQPLSMTLESSNSTGSVWDVVIPNAWLSLSVQYYLTIHVQGALDPQFSTPFSDIYIMVNYFTIPIIILALSGLGIILWAIVRWNYRSDIKKKQELIDETQQRIVRRNYLIQTGVALLGQGILILGLWQPIIFASVWQANWSATRDCSIIFDLYSVVKLD